MSYPYFPFTYPDNIGYEGWRPYIQSQYMLDVLRRVAARNSEDSHEIYCHYRPGDISLTSNQAAEILAKYEQHGQAYVYCDGDEDPDVTKSKQFVFHLFFSLFVIFYSYFYIKSLWYFTMKYWCAETNDNIPTDDDDYIVDVPEDIPLDIPDKKVAFQVWQKHYYKAMCVGDGNGVARDYHYGFNTAFVATLSEYDFHIKKQLKYLETVLNSNERKIDRRLVSKDSFFFPISRYLYKLFDHEWNCDDRAKLSNLPVPNRNICLQELYNNVDDVLLSCDETGLELPADEVFRRAFNETISSYKIAVFEQLELQEPLLTKHQDRINWKLAEIDKIERMSYIEKVKFYYELKRQHKEKQKKTTMP